MTEYGYRRQFETRWNDNDVYGHLNNTIYYEAMDTTITHWLITEAGYSLGEGDTMAFCVSSSCQFAASGAFPDTLRVELGTGRVGSTSVAWKLGIFRESDGELLANGEFVHVFVGSETKRPVPIPAGIRAAIEAQLVGAE
ncbi:MULTISPECIES: acyl-CoA thioesterase [Subtercola]|uniref:Acyl-CoA thioesterase n=1 Tax=Subtercola vilae TaxID=2056433 RepID=A0A4V4REA5_9MICO|nr:MULTISPECIES: thioesterase family protein [Subtercola]MEA9986349.1 thioesterase family protein [Subtercola sp. RTI3]TIH33024.1 acyl-CoA thioesterase [Subtercola vilae]